MIEDVKTTTQDQIMTNIHILKFKKNQKSIPGTSESTFASLFYCKIEAVPYFKEFDSSIYKTLHKSFMINEG